MSPAPGIYEGKLPDSLVMGRCYLNYALATEDSTEDTDKFPDKRRRPSSEVKLYVQPTLTGPFYSQEDETLYSVEPFVLTSNNGKFDFWAIDPTHSSIIPSGWVWTATLVDGSKTVGNITFSPDSTKPADQYVNLGLLAVTGSVASGSTAADLQSMLQTLLDSSSTGPAGRGIRTITSAGDVATVTYTDNTTQDFALPRGESGATPELTWSGTTLLINGSNGVDLKGAKGDAGPANTLSIGTVTEGNAAATITGTSPSQVLNLVVPKGAKGDQGIAGSPTPLTGTGFPAAGLGVVGDQYIDTAATIGALVWRKWPSGWKVQEGDTGWRKFDVVAMYPDDFSGGGFYVRRHNQFLTWAVDVALKNTGTRTQWRPIVSSTDLPAEYRMSTNKTGQFLGNLSSSDRERMTGDMLIENSLPWVSIIGSNLGMAQFGGLRGQFTRLCDLSWPTTLPGTPA